MIPHPPTGSAPVGPAAPPAGPAASAASPAGPVTPLAHSAGLPTSQAEPVTARIATPADAAELVRLRAVMLRSMSGPEWDDDWREPARLTFRERLAGPEATLAAFVVDRPDGGLAACAVGTIEHRLGTPGDPFGLAGYVFNVATDPDMRRRGYSRACLDGLVGWFRERGIRKVDLRATPEGEPLYRSLGFIRATDPAMRLRLPTG